MCEPRSWRQWCVLCNKECLNGFYIRKTADSQRHIEQWHLCPECSSNPPKFRSYEELAAVLVAEALQ